MTWGRLEEGYKVNNNNNNNTDKVSFAPGRTGVKKFFPFWSRPSSVSLFSQRPQSLPEGWRPLLAIYVSQQRRKSLPNNVIIKYRVKSPIFTRILREPTLVAHAKPPSTKNITTQREL
jgi:hypothetical protein